MIRLLAQTDVVIVGGGPAGLAAAIAARMQGLQVAVIDASTPPIDKACGEGLMPDGVDAVTELGVKPGPDEAFAFRGIRFIGARATAEADFTREPALGIRRTILHNLLIKRAKETGVSLHWSRPVVSVTAQGVITRDGLVRGRWIIGADGQNSHIRQWAGLSRSRGERRRFGYRRHYATRWTQHAEVYWGDRVQIYVTPIAADETCVALISSDPRLRLDRALGMFPDLARKLDQAALISRERGAVSNSRVLHAVQHGNFALVGDASGSVDAITGEGLNLAFRQALVLASALKRGDLHSYETAHRKLARKPHVMARLLLAISDHEWLRRRVLDVLASEPTVFARLVGVHSGALPPKSIGADGLLAFTRRFLLLSNRRAAI